MASEFEIAENRSLTEQEYRLVRWMLEHGKPEALRYIEQLDHARVASRCYCGCASINFAIDDLVPPGGDTEVLADFEFGEEVQLCGAFVFARDGKLAGLEVCGYAVDAPRILPNVEKLRPVLV
jgi:hypothetical protein